MSSQPNHDSLIRFSAVSALVALAADTAVVSYQHAYSVVRAVGNTQLLAILIPFVPDLTIFTAYMVCLEATRASQRKPPLAIAALWGGIGVTVVMNAAAGWSHGKPGALVAALAPLALIVALHILVGRGHPAPTAASAGPHVAGGVPCPHGEARTAEDVVRLIHAHAGECMDAPLSMRDLAAITVPSRPTVAKLVKQSVNGSRPHPPAADPGLPPPPAGTGLAP